jgi:hypothetical protein
MNIVNSSDSYLKINYCICSVTSIEPGSSRMNPFIYQVNGNLTVINCLFYYFFFLTQINFILFKLI